MPKYIGDYLSHVPHTKVFQGHEHNASWLKYRSYFPFASSLSSSFQNPNRRQTGTWKQQQDECEQTNEPF